MIYYYQTVSGASLWGKLGSIYGAKKNVNQLRQRGWPNAEVERVLKIGYSGQRYWRWRDGKWSTKFWTEPNEQDLKKWNQ